MVAGIMLAAACVSMVAVGRRGLTSPDPLRSALLGEDNEEEQHD